MKLRDQDIIKYIPIINFLIIFVWIKFNSKNATPLSRFIKNGLKMSIGIILLQGVRMSLCYIIESDIITIVIFWLFVYLTMLFVDLVAIKDQKDYFNKK